MLLELVFSEEDVEADSELSICINYTVFLFVMAYNNKKVGPTFGCHVTYCVQNKHKWFFKFPLLRYIWLYPARFFVFLK